MKVLVVHRQQEILQNIKDQLQNWYVEAYTNGLEGLLAAKLSTFDLILCGQDLPVVTGIEMVRSIRNLSLNQHTPVILLAEGNETKEHWRISQSLRANLMTLEEVGEMKNLTIE
ncbi:MAG: response regulator [Bacteroidetes bacterium]|nr:response regulator [Bacteroidota bacterium]MBS1540004.1 response regulator [Bacteroidota bacterium]